MSSNAVLPSSPWQAGAIERRDRWSLPYQDLRVSQLRLDALLTFVLEDTAELTVSCPALLIRTGGGAAGTVRIAPHRQEVAGALELFGARVMAAVAFKDGRLRVLFDGGTQLHIPPDSWYEAWNAVGPGSLRAVCLPRGGLAIWA
jgi:Family of unknown function (DUF6188)